MSAHALVMTASLKEDAPTAGVDHPEAELVDRLLAGDEAAYRLLYREHSADVFRLARRFVYSEAEAEEVVQEVFLAAFKNLDRFRRESRLKTWLYRITVNRALKRQRWWNRRREVGPEPLQALSLTDHANPEIRARDREALAMVSACLEKLDRRKRTVLVLHELEGLDTREIAEVLGCPRSTVLTRLSRARAELIRMARRAGITVTEEGE